MESDDEDTSAFENDPKSLKDFEQLKEENEKREKELRRLEEMEKETMEALEKGVIYVLFAYIFLSSHSSPL
jgi:hypothetical protein